MSGRQSAVVLGAVIVLAACACGAHLGSFADDQPVEDCGAVGDEDGNGLADCLDPACTDTPACRGRCGDGRLDPGEKCDDGNTTDGDGCESDCTLPTCGNGIRDPGESCDDGNLTDGDECSSRCALPTCGNNLIDDGEVCDDGNAANGDGCDARCSISTTTYVKASNTRYNDQFGTAVALSADGSTLAVGAPLEDSAASGIDGDQTDSAAANAGAVYVYMRSGTTWRQQAYIKASTPRMGAQFGTTVALSSDGSTLAVGAIGESSAATGINGDEADTSASGSGAVYLFTRTAATWRQQAYIKASNTGRDDRFGSSVALAADGTTLAVGALGETSAATGIDGEQTHDPLMQFAGAVYVFTRTSAIWQQQAYVKASNTGKGDCFGTSVTLSADATTLVVGAVNESSAAQGIDGDQTSDAMAAAGAAYVFTRSGTVWSQQAYVKASNPGRADRFGVGVALSADGATLAVGAYAEDSAATGIDGDQTNNDALVSGAAYVFTRAGTVWSQQAYVKASNTGLTDQFGWAIALSPDGATMAVGAVSESSAATGIGGDQTNDDAFDSGAIYVFRRTGALWHQQAYVKASNTGVADEFGSSIALAADGTLAAGAVFESSRATGISGDQTDETVESGAVYIIQ